MDFMDEIKKRLLIFDGSKGYMLQRAGLSGGSSAEEWNILYPEKVKELYTLYRDAGCDVIQTNTFQGGAIQLAKHGLEDKAYEINYEGARMAREVMDGRGFTAASIGPVGMLLEPSGELDYEKAYKVYFNQIKALVDGGVQIINFETFTDMAEMRIALIASKDAADIPVICSVAFEENKRTLMGTDPYNAALTLHSLGAEIVGTNCSFGAESMVDIVREMSRSGCYLSVKPNAGLPKMVDGVMHYEETAEHFAQVSKEFIKYGARLIGGCCGTTPEFIKVLKEKVKDIKIPDINKNYGNEITSLTKIIDMKEYQNIKKSCFKIRSDLIKQSIIKSDLMVLLDDILDLEDEDTDVIIVDHSEFEGIERYKAFVVNYMQGMIKKPFIFKTENDGYLEEVLRIYRGRPGIITENENVKKTAQKYGAVLIN